MLRQVQGEDSTNTGVSDVSRATRELFEGMKESGKRKVRQDALG